MSAKEFLSSLAGKELPEDLANSNAVFHFDFGGGADYSLSTESGKVVFSEGFIGTPECTVKAKAEDFISIVQGETNPMAAMMMGKLKISNPGVMLKYAKVFGIM